MAREERQSLLHHGTSTTTTMSAYVEIVFDSEPDHTTWPSCDCEADDTRLGRTFPYQQPRAVPETYDRSEEGRILARQEERKQGRGHESVGKRRLLKEQPVLHRPARPSTSPSRPQLCRAKR